MTCCFFKKKNIRRKDRLIRTERQKGQIKELRLFTGVKEVRELQGGKTYVRGRGKGKYYERLRGLGGERDDIGR